MERWLIQRRLSSTPGSQDRMLPDDLLERIVCPDRVLLRDDEDSLVDLQGLIVALHDLQYPRNRPSPIGRELVASSSPMTNESRSLWAE